VSTLVSGFMSLVFFVAEVSYHTYDDDEDKENYDEHDRIIGYEALIRT
jgi:hypothetical protein